ncbi:MAG: Uma2 family endonuclease [Microcoleaceae cyanobacterium]
MQVQIEKRYYTPEEYLSLEKTAEYKSEYHNGEIIPMTGGTTNHNLIAGNFYVYLRYALREKSYKVFFADVRLSIPLMNRYVYPDVMIIQGKPVYAGTGKTTITNPLIIVEVLSESTKNYDKGEKFDFYRSIPEFREYILIDQSKYYLAQYTKTSENQWLFTEYNGENNILKLATVEV